MSMVKSFGLAAVGATAGMIGGNYLYNLDKEANKYKEVPVPFYTVRKVADDIGKETKKMVDDIKAKCQPKQEEVTEEKVHQMTDEEVAQELEQPQVHEVTDEEVAEELNNNNQQIIDAEVVDGKAVPVDAEGNPISVEEDKQDEQNHQENQEAKVVGNTEEATIPQFTVVDQVPVNKEDKSEPEKKPTTKATTKGSKNKATK